MAEADLYLPIKRFLERQGYNVKGEIGACDLVAVRGDDDPVLVELKERLNLALLLQAVARQSMSESVYVAFRVGNGQSASWNRHRKRVTAVLRRLGLGLLTVAMDDTVTAVLDPGPYRPRISKVRRGWLLKEFEAREGDPELGGSPSRPRMTAYRQDALRCAKQLAAVGTASLAELREATGVERAGRILQANHYGWFERVRVGHYRLTREGLEAVGR